MIYINFVSSNPARARCTLYNIMWSSLSVTCGMSVVFPGYSGFLQKNWLPRYNWNIAVLLDWQRYYLSMYASVICIRINIIDYHILVLYSLSCAFHDTNKVYLKLMCWCLYTLPSISLQYQLNEIINIHGNTKELSISKLYMYKHQYKRKWRKINCLDLFL
jgi:hypothetical protein